MRADTPKTYGVKLQVGLPSPLPPPLRFDANRRNGPKFYNQLVSLASSLVELINLAQPAARRRIRSAAAHYTRVTSLVVYQSEIAAYLPLSLGNHFLLTSIPFLIPCLRRRSVLGPEHEFRLTCELGCCNDSSPTCSLCLLRVISNLLFDLSVRRHSLIPSSSSSNPITSYLGRGFHLSPDDDVDVDDEVIILMSASPMRCCACTLHAMSVRS